MVKVIGASSNCTPKRLLERSQNASTCIYSSHVIIQSKIPQVQGKHSSRTRGICFMKSSNEIILEHKSHVNTNYTYIPHTIPKMFQILNCYYGAFHQL